MRIVFIVANPYSHKLFHINRLFASFIQRPAYGKHWFNSAHQPPSRFGRYQPNGVTGSSGSYIQHPLYPGVRAGFVICGFSKEETSLMKSRTAPNGQYGREIGISPLSVEWNRHTSFSAIVLGVEELSISAYKDNLMISTWRGNTNAESSRTCTYLLVHRFSS